MRRRGKKKNKESQDIEKSAEAQDTLEDKKNQLEEDQDLIQSCFNTLSSTDAGPIKNWEEISRVAEMIAGGESGESLESLQNVEQETLDKQTLQRFNCAVGRVAAHRKDLINEKLEIVRKRTDPLDIQEIIKMIQSGSSLPLESQGQEIPAPEVDVQNATGERSVTSSSSESDSSESCHTSDSSDSSDSSDTSSEDSEEEETSSDEEEESIPRLTGVAGDPNIIRWYQDWMRGVAQQRQAIQTAEYYRYLQYYGYQQ